MNGWELVIGIGIAGVGAFWIGFAGAAGWPISPGIKLIAYGVVCIDRAARS